MPQNACYLLDGCLLYLFQIFPNFGELVDNRAFIGLRKSAGEKQETESKDGCAKKKEWDMMFIAFHTFISNMGSCFPVIIHDSSRKGRKEPKDKIWGRSVHILRRK